MIVYVQNFNFPSLRPDFGDTHAVFFVRASGLRKVSFSIGNGICLVVAVYRLFCCTLLQDRIHLPFSFNIKSCSQTRLSLGIWFSSKLGLLRLPSTKVIVLPGCGESCKK